MSLNDSEKKQLASLLEKIDNTEIRGEIWHQLVKKFITVPVELCILDDMNRVFLVYRKDREFDGYHMPGSVVNDWETVDEAVLRLIRQEITEAVGIEITEPESIGWIDSPREATRREPSPRHGILLLHIARFHGEFTPREGMGFYSLDELPPNVLGCHLFALEFFRRYVDNGEPILGI